MRYCFNFCSHTVTFEGYNCLVAYMRCLFFVSEENLRQEDGVYIPTVAGAAGLPCQAAAAGTHMGPAVPTGRLQLPGFILTCRNTPWKLVRHFVCFVFISFMFFFCQPHFHTLVQTVQTEGMTVRTQTQAESRSGGLW